jgi:glycosyltransferase involved in cell wall biosynthesis
MVCFVFPPRFSGAALQALALAGKLRDWKTECDFLVPNFADRRWWRRDDEGGHRIFRVGKTRGAWEVPFGLLWLLLSRRRRYDVVHFHGFAPSHFLCVYIARAFGLVIVQKLTKGDERRNELSNGGMLGRLRRAAIRRIDRFVAISSALVRALTHHRVPSARICFVPNGVEVGAYAAREGDAELQRVALRHYLELAPGEQMAICVGVLDRRKHTLELLESLVALRAFDAEAYRRLRVVFIGPPHNAEYVAEVMAYVKQEALQERVVFVGAATQPQLREFYAAADLCLFAGSNEGLPNALLEAKAAALPIVAYRSYGVEDVVRHDVDGLLISFDDRPGFAAAIARLMANASERRAFALAAAQDCRERYALEKVAQRYIEDVYAF